MNVGLDFDGTIDEFYEEFQFSTRAVGIRHGAAVGSLIREKDTIDSIQRIFARLIRYKAAAIHMIVIAKIMNWRGLASDASRRNKLSSYWYVVTHIEILLILSLGQTYC